MGWLSDAWDSTKDAVSDAWDSTKGAVKDFTGLDSMNDFFNPIAQGSALLQGKGIIGDALQPLLGPLTAVPPQGMPGQMTGPLAQNAPANLTMGTGGQPAPQVVQPSAQDLAGLFGESGYQFGGPSQTSTALLQANPEAYQYQPLMSGLS